jgi:hypothetical protein
LTKESFQLKIGDIVVDTIQKDIGVLIRRYQLFENLNSLLGDTEEIYEDVIVWDIFWTGPNLWLIDSGVQTYTEQGLEILLEAGALVHYENI